VSEDKRLAADGPTSNTRLARGYLWPGSEIHFWKRSPEGGNLKIF